MRLRNLNVLSKVALLSTVGLLLVQTAFGNEKSPAPAHLRLDDVSSFVAGNNIHWDVRRIGTSEVKRLIPNGMIAKSCINHEYTDASGKTIRERASMKLVPHPNPDRPNERIVYITLTSQCQKRATDKLVANADNAPKFETEAAIDDTTELASLFQNLVIPQDFSGTISVCALAHGGTTVSALEKRLEGNCTALTLNDGGAELVEDGNKIISAERRGQIAQNNARIAREKNEAIEKERNFQEAMLAGMSFHKAQCEGNLVAMNRALSALASFGVKSRDLGIEAIAASIALWKADLKKATTVEEVEAIEERFLRAEASLRDETAKKNFKMELVNRYIEIATNNIGEIAKMDSAEARLAEANIRTAKTKVKELLAGKDQKDKLVTVEGLNEKLVNVALKNGDPSKARELAQAGAERTSGAAQLRYIKAERRILEKQFKSCVDKAAEKEGAADKCDKIKLAAGKVHKKLVEASDGVVSEEALSDLKDEGKDLFGRPQGYVMTPFGPVFQQGMMGEFDAYRQKSVYEVMMENMMQYQYMGMGGQQSMMGPMGGMMGGQMGGMGARMPQMMGGMPMGGIQMGGFGQGARGSFGMNQMQQYGGSPMRMF